MTWWPSKEYLFVKRLRHGYHRGMQHFIVEEVDEVINLAEQGLVLEAPSEEQVI